MPLRPQRLELKKEKSGGEKYDYERLYEKR
jgi:hypothetical protein